MQMQQKECSICLDTLADGSIINLPSCKHTFHTKCFVSFIETNFKSKLNTSCPICRNVIIDIGDHPDIVQPPHYTLQTITNMCLHTSAIIFAICTIVFISVNLAVY